MDSLEAVYDYITAFTDIAPANVLQGYERRNVLPKTQDYCIFEMDGESREGSNIQTWTDTETTLKRLKRFSVIVDFIGNDRQTQERRARNLEILSRSLEGADFFEERGHAILYTESVQYLPFVDDSDEYTHRYRVNLRLAKWESVTLSEETAKEARLKFIKNVDTLEE